MRKRSGKVRGQIPAEEKDDLKTALEDKEVDFADKTAEDESAADVSAQQDGANKKAVKGKSPKGDKPKFELPSLLPDVEIDELQTPEDVHGDVLLDETVVQTEFSKAAEREKPKSKKKNIIFSLVFLAINIVLVAFIASSLLKSTDASFVDVFRTQGKRMWWLVLALGFLAIAFVGDAAAFFILIKKITGKYRPWLAYKTTSMGKYYESVTPLALGMQPGQIVELTKGGVSAGVATCIPIMKMIVYNLMNVILGIVFLLGVGSQIASVSALADMVLIIFKVLAYIGIIISGGTILVVILIANSKIVGRSLARFVVRTGYKLRIVKNYRESYGKLMKSVLEFQNSMNYFKKHKGVLFGCIGCITLSLLALASLPFAMTMALSDVTFSSFGEGLWYWLECVSRYYICFNASSYIPLPGGTGMMEIAFISMYGSKRFLSGNIVWGFLFWRVISYYLIIVQGMIMVIVDTTRTIVNARKQAKLLGEPKKKKDKNKRKAGNEQTPTVGGAAAENVKETADSPQTNEA